MAKTLLNEQCLSINQCKELVALGIDMQNAYMGYLCEKDRFESGKNEYSYNATVIGDDYNFKNNWRWEDNVYKELKDDEYINEDSEFTDFYYIPTFTLQDILEILKKEFQNYANICILYEGNTWICARIRYSSIEEMYSTDYEFFGDTPLEATFNMLKWYKQNKLSFK